MHCSRYRTLSRRSGWHGWMRYSDTSNTFLFLGSTMTFNDFHECIQRRHGGLYETIPLWMIPLWMIPLWMIPFWTDFGRLLSPLIRLFGVRKRRYRHTVHLHTGARTRYDTSLTIRLHLSDVTTARWCCTCTNSLLLTIDSASPRGF